MISDAVAVSLVGFAGLLATGIFNIYDSRRIANATAKKVEEVRTTVAASTADTVQKLERIEKKGIDNHTLLNNEKGRMLTVVAVSLRALATYTRAPLDIAAAEDAERDKHNHDRQQAIVDAGKET